MQDIIGRIEDYVAGNIEGVEDVDRMAFTAFLREALLEQRAEFVEELEGLDVKAPWASPVYQRGWEVADGLWREERDSLINKYKEV